ncbi:hypothetical protein CBR_g46804 [Chara braunii]|uniref:CCHC-type domain-containing protein n=1 Tax=Chara braunii TaxID=69332 RepID=A0A388M0Y6_CHABU|nr:hypothetical protein CBR_g46804 [Chara braunii]|eukprot:GBG88237.1 hypothetical protein CBR_g46804 [Chara braunii]
MACSLKFTIALPGQEVSSPSLRRRDGGREVSTSHRAPAMAADFLCDRLSAKSQSAAAAVALTSPTTLSSSFSGDAVCRRSSSASSFGQERKSEREAEGRAWRHAAGVKAMAVLAAEPIEMSEVVMWTGGKRLQTQTAPIATDTTTIRSLDWDRDRFDIEFGLQNGTTYNSYIIQGEKTAVIDASHEKFRELYLNALRKQIGLSTISYIVANHTEPDHSGLIADLVEIVPNATVVGSKICIQFLQNLILKPFKSQVVKNGDTLDLGNGHVLEFVMAPNLHWPDTIFTLDRATGILFTCDAFGMHYCGEALYDEELPKIEPHYRFYYDCLMRPNAKSVLSALKRTADMSFNTIAVGHGPLLRYNVDELVGKYANWSKDAVEKQSASVAVLYCSDYGYSDRLSQALARGITKTETGVEMMDLNSADTQELIECVGRNGALVVMTPPQKGPANEAVSTLLAAVTSKQPILIAESFGGDDEPVDPLMSRFAELGLTPAFAPLKVKDVPTEATYQLFEEAGTDLGQKLTQKNQIKGKKMIATDVAKAIARISGGLYIVTTVKGDSKGAMVASWVSQASFKPLGITIAVAKDRAIESLMQAQILEDFVRTAYKRWHDPQGAQKATDAINNLCGQRYKNVHEVTYAIECLIVVPGVHFDPQVLLTYYLRCLPTYVKNKLVDEAYIEQHSFASFSKKVLDIEAKLRSTHQSQGDGRKKRLLQDREKNGQLMFVDHDGQTTEIDDFPDLGDATEQDGASETSDWGVVAPIKEKVRGIGKQKVGQSTGQGDQGIPAWVKLGLDYEVWRDRVARGTCMNCGNYGHTSTTCRGNKVTMNVASPTVVGLSSNPSGASASTSQGNTSG